ncbi:glycosyltransferase family 2 protein [Phenylobacterium sp.]|uniref:glycosyltransferase family 2 protein n=1 Tax=Phenylobacterium sp. TaxID=1871053 RepID=UPI002FC953B0
MNIIEVQLPGGEPVVVEWNPKYPLTAKWDRRLREAAGKDEAAVAFTWDDAFLRRTRGLRLDPFRLAWPRPHPLLLAQVDCRGRCAIAKSVLQGLHQEGRIASATDTAGALRILADRMPDRIRQVPEILRLTWAEGSPAYRRTGAAPTPSRTATRISVVINYRDRPDLMQECIRGLMRQALRSELEVLLIDNQSTAESVAAVRAACKSLKGRASVRHFTYAEPFNKSAQDNLGAREASGEVIVFLNNDAEMLDVGCLQTISDWALEPDALAAGPRVLGDGDRLVSNGVFIRRAVGGATPLIRENEAKPLQETIRLSAGVSFCCAAVAKATFERIGPFDEQVFKSQYNDADFWLRGLRLGFSNIYVGSVSCRHEPGQSEARTKEKTAALLVRFCERHVDLADYADIDLDVVKLKAIPEFAERGPRWLMQGARLWRKGRARLVDARRLGVSLVRGVAPST